MAKRKAPALPTVAVLRLSHGEGLELPAYKTADAAGMDLLAAVEAETPLHIAPGTWRAVPTGLALALPRGTEGQVRPRSGLALRHGVTVLNSPGTIDADYRGEVQVLLVNHGPDVFEIRRGDRIAQLIVAPVVQTPLTEVSRLGDTSRGAGGFGSTGVRSAPPTVRTLAAKTKTAAKAPSGAPQKKTRISKTRPTAKRGSPKRG